MDRSRWPLLVFGLALAALVVAILTLPLAPQGGAARTRYLGCLGADVPGAGARGKKPSKVVASETEAAAADGEADAPVAPADGVGVAEGEGEDGAEDALAGGEAPIVLVPVTTVAAPYADGLSGDVSTPLWSADGKYLAYEVGTPAGTEMVIAAVEGTTPRPGVRIGLPKRGGDTGPAWGGAWLPNPRLLLFVGGDPSRVLFYAPGGSSSSEMMNQTLEPGALTAVSPSRDGSQVVYLTASQVSVWARATGGVKRFEAPGAQHPAFSPDGASVLYDAPGAKGRDVHRLVLASGEDTVVAGGPDDQVRPVDLGRDGVLAFVSDAASTWIAVYQRGVPRALAERVAIGPRGRPAVSPDGAVVAWAPLGGRAVALTRIADGDTVEVEVPLPDVGDVALAVDRDGARVAFTYLDAGRRRLALADVSAAYAEVKRR